MRTGGIGHGVAFSALQTEPRAERQAMRIIPNTTPPLQFGMSPVVGILAQQMAPYVGALLLAITVLPPVEKLLAWKAQQGTRPTVGH